MAAGTIGYFFNPYHYYLEHYYEGVYDSRTGQKPIKSTIEIDQVLAGFSPVSFNKLDTAYISYSRSGEQKYKKILNPKIYYEVHGEDIFKYLVGKFRVKDFLVKDKYYWYNLYHLSEKKGQYFLVDKKMLYALLQLQQELEKSGYDPEAFIINYAHRHPALNVEVGGASVSHHIQGQAVDLVIKDINKDGVIKKEDKKIVLDILENKIIKDKGGIGRYPWSMVVHFDVRGYKARWDKQK